jgi:hypothetical protein
MSDLFFRRSQFLQLLSREYFWPEPFYKFNKASLIDESSRGFLRYADQFFCTFQFWSSTANYMPALFGLLLFSAITEMESRCKMLYCDIVIKIGVLFYSQICKMKRILLQIWTKSLFPVQWAHLTMPMFVRQVYYFSLIKLKLTKKLSLLQFCPLSDQRMTLLLCIF